MQLNPFKYLTDLPGKISELPGKFVRPVLRRLAGEAGEQNRSDREMRRKVAVAAVAIARARTQADVPLPVVVDGSNSLTAWQAVTRGRTIKGRGNR